VKWVNDLVDSQGNPLPHLFAVDPTVTWANPNNMVIPTAPFLPYPPGYAEAQTPVPITVHVHGAEVQSTSDGAPNTWFTPNGIHGPDYYSKVPTQANAAVYEYPNSQLPTTIWYHDHALGLDRLNVMAGLAGFYLIRDKHDTVASHLPSGKYEIPIAIQDRTFNTDASIFYPSDGNNPDVHPYWIPEFFGNAIMVNGQTWPNLNVEPRQYRFRLLEGSNARFYTFSFWDQNTGRVLPFTQIGGDGSYLPYPVTTTELTFAPGERLDIVVDFTGIDVGDKIIMMNSANAPYPDGDPVDPATTGQLMQFTVVPAQGDVHHKTIPNKLIDMKMLVPDTPTAIHTLYEVEGLGGPLEVTLDGQSMMAPVSEMPRVGSTQDWIFVDTTMDVHPMHMHLVQFQLIKRQTFDSMAYTMDWIAANGGQEPPFANPTVNINIDNYLTGIPKAPQPNELGWKDTMKVYPGEIAEVRIRWAPLDAQVTGPNAPYPGLNLYPFDPTVGPGYMWHCHILEHEENDMMRMYMVMP
jgi:FtsP/CotA-like multicopper oxidase with cupredoxin domain